MTARSQILSERACSNVVSGALDSARMIDPRTLRGDWNYPTRMRFGPGRIAELADACAELGIARPLLVTDPGLIALPMVGATISYASEAGLTTSLFAHLQGNPVGRNVSDGLKAYREGEHDGIIALGGGSAIDTGKAIALMAGQTRPLWDFEDARSNWRRADPGAIAPCVAIPTTAGTGSEVGRASAIIDESAGVKKIIFHPKMLPAMVISDPELTLSLPPGITAATGMDALTHCIEALCAPGFHPMADGIALEGARLVRDWLPVAYMGGQDLAARAHMLIAASMGATAFQKGLGAVHSISHALGAVHQVHHGLANAIALPYVLRFNREAIQEPCARLARLIGLPGKGFNSILRWVLDLRAILDIPHTFGKIGIGEEEADRIAGLAARDPTAATNPVKVGEKDLREIFLASVRGE